MNKLAERAAGNSRSTDHRGGGGDGLANMPEVVTVDDDVCYCGMSGHIGPTVLPRKPAASK